MMPPNCCLCENGTETGHQCELVYFSRTEGDRQWYAMMEKGKGFTGHPPDCDWFCDLHAASAKSLIHYDRPNAIRYLRENESWQLIYIDLFDRDTPPSVQRSGVGFESGFEEFWHRILATTEADGRRYPSDFRLKFANKQVAYDLPRDCPELTTIKKHLGADKEAPQAIRLFAIEQAAQMRKGGLSEAEKYLTQRCKQLSCPQT